jgi:hypothetical protein
LKKVISILTIIASGLVSIIISTAWVNYGAMELGALIYLLIPLITVTGTILLFLVADIFLKEERNLLTITFICINILTGILMRLDFYHNILNL